MIAVIVLEDFSVSKISQKNESEQLLTASCQPIATAVRKGSVAATMRTMILESRVVVIVAAVVVIIIIIVIINNNNYSEHNE